MAPILRPDVFRAYQKLAAELLDLKRGLPLLAGEEGQKHVAGLGDFDDAKLCAVVCQLVPGMTADWWQALNAKQRIAWMQQAVAAKDAMNERSEWSDIKPAATWRKELKISKTTWSRWIREGKLVIRGTTKNVQIRLPLPDRTRKRTVSNR